MSFPWLLLYHTETKTWTVEPKIKEKKVLIIIQYNEVIGMICMYFANILVLWVT